MHGTAERGEKRRDVVERLRGNRNLGAKEEGRAGKPDDGEERGGPEWEAGDAKE